jgi:putative tryptophan/tyrosine transport system substrate-binding protein
MQFGQLKRREFMSLLGGAAAWPLAARAQQGQPTRRVGVLMPVSKDEPDNQSGAEAFVQALNQLVSAEKRQVQIDVTWGNTDPSEIRRLAEQLIARAPHVIVASGDSTVAPVLRSTQIVPVIFNNVTDPVGAGFVESLAKHI